MSITHLPLSYTKDELLAALRAEKAKAEKRDAVALAVHRKAEQKYLVEFRKACREAVKWDYKKVKDNGGYVMRGRHGRSSAPSCPTSEASRIDSLIVMVERINQPRFTLSNNGKWHAIYRVLIRDVPEIKGVC